MSDTSTGDWEKDLETLWSNYKVNPTYMGMSLKNLRDNAFKFGGLRPDVAQLLADCTAFELDENTTIWWDHEGCWINEEAV